VEGPVFGKRKGKECHIVHDLFKRGVKTLSGSNSKIMSQRGIHGQARVHVGCQKKGLYSRPKGHGVIFSGDRYMGTREERWPLRGGGGGIGGGEFCSVFGKLVADRFH